MSLVWMQCDCHVWPITLGGRIGRCGECGQQPDRCVEEPESGKAERA